MTVSAAGAVPRLMSRRAQSDTLGMKHIKDAQQFLDKGDSAQALSVIENLLGLAPRNPEALRMKARILDGWGRFDDSLSTLHQLSQLPNLPEECLLDIERRALEEKETIIYSELSHEGRWYFAFPRSQVWISLAGFLGCATFLLLSPSLLSEGAESFSQLILSFTIFVLLPWLGLMAVHLTGVKRVLVGLHGIRVCRRFSELALKWEEMGGAIIEFDQDPASEHLKLLIFSKEDSKRLLATFDISPSRSVVRARRHFVRNVLSYVDTVCYLQRRGDGSQEIPAPEEVATDTVAASQNPGQVA